MVFNDFILIVISIANGVNLNAMFSISVKRSFQFQKFLYQIKYLVFLLFFRAQNL